MSIIIKTKLDSRVIDSVGDPIVSCKFATTPRNLLRALRMLKTTRMEMRARYGDVGCGSTWLEIDGRAQSRFELQFIDSVADARELIAEFASA